MKELIKSVKDFKIIPNNFKSAGSFEVLNVNDEYIEIKLLLDDVSELNDYEENASAEVFGVNDVGLVYFETKIISRTNDILKLATTQDFSIIQRREYSRVNLKQGSVEFKDISNNIIKEVVDISAGGIKLIAYEALNTDKIYDIELDLSNNMKINCSLQPIRIKELPDKTFDISGKFLNLENIDRIVLVQYAFKIKMENQNKEG